MWKLEATVIQYKLAPSRALHVSSRIGETAVWQSRDRSVRELLHRRLSALGAFLRRGSATVIAAMKRGPR